MRDKVLEAIELYSAGGTIDRALESVGISNTPFRRVLRENPEVMALYEGAMRSRAYVFQDEAYVIADEIGSENGLDAKSARAKADILIKLSNTAHPDRFGDRINLQHELKPSLAGAIEEGKRRSLLPQRDLAQIADAQVIDITPQSISEAPDKQSEDAPTAADLGFPDPFEA